MAGLRIECTGDQIEEIYSRLGHVFHTNDLSKPYPTRNNADLQYYYCRIYIYEPNTLLEQLLAAQKDLQEMALEQDRLLAIITELKQKLGEIPQPKPWDAVLGGKGN